MVLLIKKIFVTTNSSDDDDLYEINLVFGDVDFFIKKLKNT